MSNSIDRVAFDITPGLVRFLYLDSNNRYYTAGTGWVVDEDQGLIVTAYHVIKDIELVEQKNDKVKQGDLVTVEFFGEIYKKQSQFSHLVETKDDGDIKATKTLDKYKLEVFKLDIEADVCILKTTTDLPSGVKGFPLGYTDNHNEQVKIFGFPKKNSRDVRVVQTRGTAPIPEASLFDSIQLEANGIRKGHSGGPVINMETGNIVGLVRSIELNTNGSARSAFLRTSDTIQRVFPSLQQRPAFSVQNAQEAKFHEAVRSDLEDYARDIISGSNGLMLYDEVLENNFLRSNQQRVRKNYTAYYPLLGIEVNLLEDELEDDDVSEDYQDQEFHEDDELDDYENADTHERRVGALDEINQNQYGEIEVETSTTTTVLSSVHLTTLIAKEPRLMLRAKAGSGKTTTLKYITVHQCKKFLSGEEPSVPILIRAKKYNPNRGFQWVILEQFLRRGDRSEVAYFRALMKFPGLQIFVDGLNEIPPAYYDQALRELKSLMGDFHETRFVITSRPAFFQPTNILEYFGRHDGMKFYDVLSLQETDFVSFLERCFAKRQEAPNKEKNKEKAEKMVAEIVKNPVTKDLIYNPLYLDMMANLSQDSIKKAKNVISLFKQFTAKLLKDWSSRSSAKAQLADSEYLPYLAFCMVTQPSPNFSEVCHWMQSKLSAFDQEKTIDFLSEVMNCGLVKINTKSAGENLAASDQIVDSEFEFTHDDFRDYYAAKWIRRRFGKEQKLPTEVDPNEELWFKPLLLTSELNMSSSDLWEAYYSELLGVNTDETNNEGDESIGIEWRGQKKIETVLVVNDDDRKPRKVFVANQSGFSLSAALKRTPLTAAVLKERIRLANDRSLRQRELDQLLSLLDFWTKLYLETGINIIPIEELFTILGTVNFSEINDLLISNPDYISIWAPLKPIRRQLIDDILTDEGKYPKYQTGSNELRSKETASSIFKIQLKQARQTILRENRKEFARYSANSRKALNAFTNALDKPWELYEYIASAAYLENKLPDDSTSTKPVRYKSRYELEYRSLKFFLLKATAKKDKEQLKKIFNEYFDFDALLLVQEDSDALFTSVLSNLTERLKKEQEQRGQEEVLRQIKYWLGVPIKKGVEIFSNPLTIGKALVYRHPRVPLQLKGRIKRIESLTELAEYFQEVSQNIPTSLLNLVESTILKSKSLPPDQVLGQWAELLNNTYDNYHIYNYLLNQYVSFTTDKEYDPHFNFKVLVDMFAYTIEGGKPEAAFSRYVFATGRKYPNNQEFWRIANDFIETNLKRTNPELFVQLALLLAANFSEIGNNDSALRLLEECKEITPNNTKLLVLLGAVSAKQDKIEIAAEYYEAALRIQNDNIPATGGLGNCYFKLERYEEAAAKFRAELALNPENVAAARYLARSYEAMGEVDSAIEILEEIYKKWKITSVNPYELSKLTHDLIVLYQKPGISFNPEKVDEIANSLQQQTETALWIRFELTRYWIFRKNESAATDTLINIPEPKYFPGPKFIDDCEKLFEFIDNELIDNSPKVALNLLTNFLRVYPVEKTQHDTSKKTTNSYNRYAITAQSFLVRVHRQLKLAEDDKKRKKERLEQEINARENLLKSLIKYEYRNYKWISAEAEDYLEVKEQYGDIQLLISSVRSFVELTGVRKIKIFLLDQLIEITPRYSMHEVAFSSLRDIYELSSKKRRFYVLERMAKIAQKGNYHQVAYQAWWEQLELAEKKSIAAEILGQIADHAVKQDDLDTALKASEQRLKYTSKKLASSIYTDIFFLANSLRDYNKAIEYKKKQLKAARSVKDRISILATIRDTQLKSQDIEGAVKTFEEEIKITRNKKEKISKLDSISKLYVQIADFDQAKKALGGCINLCKKIKGAEKEVAEHNKEFKKLVWRERKHKQLQKQRKKSGASQSTKAEVKSIKRKFKFPTTPFHKIIRMKINTAIFFDLISIEKALEQRVDAPTLQQIEDQLIKTSQVELISTRWAYHQVDQLNADVKRDLISLGFHLSPIDFNSNKDKHKTVLNICLEIVEQMYESPHLDSFIIVSNSREFSILRKILGRSGKYLINSFFSHKLYDGIDQIGHTFVELSNPNPSPQKTKPTKEEPKQELSKNDKTQEEPKTTKTLLFEFAEEKSRNTEKSKDPVERLEKLKGLFIALANEPKFEAPLQQAAFDHIAIRDAMKFLDPNISNNQSYIPYCAVKLTDLIRMVCTDTPLALYRSKDEIGKEIRIGYRQNCKFDGIIQEDLLQPSRHSGEFYQNILAMPDDSLNLPDKATLNNVCKKICLMSPDHAKRIDILNAIKESGGEPYEEEELMKSINLFVVTKTLVCTEEAENAKDNKYTLDSKYSNYFDWHHRLTEICKVKIMTKLGEYPENSILETIL